MMIFPSVSTKTAIGFQAAEGGGGATRQGQCGQGGQGVGVRAPFRKAARNHGKTMEKPIGKA